jgi:isoleucyl-tRNA synthetase
VWTTTPWTLPSNHYVAVGARILYIKVVDPDDENKRLILALDAKEEIEKKLKKELVEDGPPFDGVQLCHKRYRPPFYAYFSDLKDSSGELAYIENETLAIRKYCVDYFVSSRTVGDMSHVQSSRIVEDRIQEWATHNKKRLLGWIVVPADFVTTDSGSGMVHIAPAFGEDDYGILQRERDLFGSRYEGPALLNAVAPDGKFTDEGPEYCRGRWVKDCDKDIIRDLKARGLLFHQEQYLHDYPFCWRAEEDPLIQYPRESWFIRTTEYKDQMLANNAKINWQPEHIRDGRFGKFLESNVDWALSRERYWGTPLPIWVCSETGKMEAVGS